MAGATVPDEKRKNASVLVVSVMAASAIFVGFHLAAGYAFLAVVGFYAWTLMLGVLLTEEWDAQGKLTDAVPWLAAMCIIVCILAPFCPVTGWVVACVFSALMVILFCCFYSEQARESISVAADTLSRLLRCAPRVETLANDSDDLSESDLPSQEEQLTCAARLQSLLRQITLACSRFSSIWRQSGRSAGQQYDELYQSDSSVMGDPYDSRRGYGADFDFDSDSDHGNEAETCSAIQGGLDQQRLS